tara:strand:+ start:189 stop:410 length:222 start_codon:yes stop_codon:yes gene_type:complete
VLLVVAVVVDIMVVVEVDLPLPILEVVVEEVQTIKIHHILLLSLNTLVVEQQQEMHLIQIGELQVMVNRILHL